MRTSVLAHARSITVAVALTAAVVACGSDGEAGEEASQDTADQDTADQDAADQDAADQDSDGTAGGDGATATLTMADGAVYVFEMSTCETSNTDEFVIPDSYDLSGRTADGEFDFYLARVGMDEDFITQVGSLEGDFDDEGKNSQLLYSADLDNEPLLVDGANVSGAFDMSAIGPTRPHGDDIGVILDVRC